MTPTGRFWVTPKEIERHAVSGSLRSRYLHLKGLLLERRRDPRWIEHVLESYEHDRQRGDLAGVAISLVTLARIFIDQGEIGRAKERLREALPYIQQCDLRSTMATFATLWGEVELAEGARAVAKSWLLSAKKIYDDSGDANGSAAVTRVLETL